MPSLPVPCRHRLHASHTPPPTFPHLIPLFFSRVFGTWEGEQGGLLGIWPFLFQFFFWGVFLKERTVGKGGMMASPPQLGLPLYIDD